MSKTEDFLYYFIRLEITYWSTPYEFKLLFRGSRDGFTSNDFHNLCDDQPRTLTVVKLEDSNEILGGYNPIVWKSGNHNYGLDVINRIGLGALFSHGVPSVFGHGGYSRYDTTKEASNVPDTLGRDGYKKIWWQV
ncbi:hypothetical protein C1645_818975 [Glomus cerebriforme]|uniref:TLDc domain-containing protein n=1 Tax=Glomus cerebriforme TaxID=658196 RepID=A0A397T696_9GLOM|nr:hypothetical protein C1645_818975 [Glomus cerebriforme]